MSTPQGKSLQNTLDAGLAHHRAGRLPEAKAIYEQILSTHPTHPIATHSLGLVAFQGGIYDVAEGLMRRAIKLRPDYGEAHHNLARLLEAIDDFDGSIKHYQRAVKIMPTNADSRYSLANVCKVAGRLEEAILHFRATIGINPRNGNAHRQMAMLVRHVEHDDDMKAMESLLEDKSLADEPKMHVHFALGKSFEDIRNYGVAFRHFDSANRIMRQHMDFEISNWLHDVEKQKQVFTSALFQKFEAVGDQQAQPIFILGMPRSGTSLVEQIVASHDAVYGAGEVQTMNTAIMKSLDISRYPEVVVQTVGSVFEAMAAIYTDELSKLRGDARFTTDKMPNNFKFIGMIKLMFPNARVIHCRRDPLDNCLSLYKNHFSRNGPYYSFDLVELGAYHNGYRDLMNHWQEVLPGFIFNIDYEEIVADLEGQSRSLLKFCGLDWQPACLDFHNTRRNVRTASAAQVRRPIYRDSVRSWRHYEEQLAPLIEVLD